MAVATPGRWGYGDDLCVLCKHPRREHTGLGCPPHGEYKLLLAKANATPTFGEKGEHKTGEGRSSRAWKDQWNEARYQRPAQKDGSLSARVRPDVEASPWVVGEFKKLEEAIDRLGAAVRALAEEYAKLAALGDQLSIIVGRPKSG